MGSCNLSYNGAEWVPNTRILRRDKTSERFMAGDEGHVCWIVEAVYKVHNCGAIRHIRDHHKSRLQ